MTTQRRRTIPGGRRRPTSPSRNRRRGAQPLADRIATNEWFDNTVRSRLNSQEKGAIIIVMQRLHADDLVAHVQQHELWDVLSFPAIAQQDESYDFLTPYGRRRIHRSTGEILQPALLSPIKLEFQRRGMTEYNFVAQYQQDPQPPSGIIVKRECVGIGGHDRRNAQAFE